MTLAVTPEAKPKGEDSSKQDLFARGAMRIFMNTITQLHGTNPSFWPSDNNLVRIFNYGLLHLRQP